MTFAFQRACAGIVAATCLSLSLAGAPAHSQRAGTEAGTGQDALSQVAPGLERYRQDVLQGNLWQRPDLSPRDRSVVTVAALIARNQTAEMPHHLNLALDNGVRLAVSTHKGQSPAPMRFTPSAPPAPAARTAPQRPVSPADGHRR